MLDVGCGAGALTGELVARLGVGAVAAVDPSASFVAATRERNPGVDVRLAAAEHLPFPSDAFDATLAQLVVHFMDDPWRGLSEMRRVTRPGGIIAACVWDHAGRRGPLRLFWDAARSLDPGLDDESQLPGTREGHLVDLFRAAGLRAVSGAALEIRVDHPTFDEWWDPFTRGVGPAGAYLGRQDPARQAAIREAALRQAPAEPIEIEAVAWAARGLA